MITPKLLREWDACWNDDRIATYFAGRDALTPRAIANDDSISLDDRLWVLCRTMWYLDESAERMFAIESASLVAHLAGDEDDQAIYAGLLNDLIQIEEEITDPGAWAAAWYAAGSAAWSAAWYAAWYAAWSAAGSAAWAAAWYAAWYTARAAAQDAELRKAIARAIEWLGDFADGWEES